jgi:hypothetical protein
MNPWKFLVNVSGYWYNSLMTNELVSSKYTFVCDPNECDCLIELTSSDGFGFPSGVTELTCPCGRKTTLVSVEHATIAPSTQTKEENMDGMTTENLPLSLAEQYDNFAKIIVKNTTSGELVYDELSPYDVNCLITDNAWMKKTITKSDSAVESVKDIITEAFADSDDQETLRSIAEALGITLTRTINWSATMYVSGSMDVDLLEEFDIDSELSDNLQVSAWNGDIEVEDYSVEDARES